MDTATADRRRRFDPRAERVPPLVVAGTLVALGVLAVSRAPYVLFRGRFWAEEGSVHFRHMVEASSPGDLFWVHQRTGYYNGFVNGATWIASYVPLRYAPLVTAWLSFGLLLVVLWVVLSWPSDLLPNAGARLAAAVLLVVGTVAVPEVWLNSLLGQTTLGIVAVLLLFVRVGELTRARYALSVGLLVVAGCSGLYAAALAPLFVAVALRDRTRRRWIHAGVLSATAVVQAAVIVHSRVSGGVNEKRSLPGPGEVVRSVGGLHFGGFAIGLPNVDGLADDVRAGSVVAMLVVGGLALAVAMLIGALLWHVPSRRVPILLVAAFVLTEGLVLLGSLDQGASGRYAVMPIALLTFMVVHGAATSAHRWLPRAAVALGALVLVMGLSQFWTATPRTLRCIGCPGWADQVRRWEAGEIDEIVVWPYDADEPWILRLPEEDR